jgi:hypothetical protein
MKGDFTSFPPSILTGVRFIVLSELIGLVDGQISVTSCMPVTIYNLGTRQIIENRDNLIVVKNKSISQEEIKRIVTTWDLGEVTMFAQDTKRLCLEFDAKKEQISAKIAQENSMRSNKMFYWFDELDENLNVKALAQNRKITCERPTKRRKHK